MVQVAKTGARKIGTRDSDGEVVKGQLQVRLIVHVLIHVEYPATRNQS